MMAQIRVCSPQVYNRLKVGGAISLVVVVALIIAVRDLWWLWLVIGLVLGGGVLGYVAYQNRRQPTPALVADEKTLRSEILEPVDVG
jgi:hypothetical protein